MQATRSYAKELVSSLNPMPELSDRCHNASTVSAGGREMTRRKLTEYVEHVLKVETRGPHLHLHLSSCKSRGERWLLTQYHA
tara:strand:- start:561 stop:806 length:246 start_codon:yes stop_codon:yes gene_type:complete